MKNGLKIVSRETIFSHKNNNPLKNIKMFHVKQSAVKK